MIYLKNKGEMDIDLLRTMGVSVKSEEDSIGYFGTGLKYAIAIFLREGIDFNLHIGKNTFSFFTEERVFREKSFDVCKMKGLDTLDLNFTTEYGKNWDLWQAYREIHSNTLDEGGTISAEMQLPESGYTLFEIDIDENHMEIFLNNENKKVLFSNGEVEIIEGVAVDIYYKGIKSLHLHKPSLFTYNLISPQKLTEDRTLAFSYQVEIAIANAIASADNERIINKAVTANNDYYESTIDATYGVGQPKQTFMEVAKKSRSSLSNNFHELYTQHEPKPKLTKEEKANLIIDQIKDICEQYNLFYSLEDGALTITGDAISEANDISFIKIEQTAE